jgi:hypothetical protein
MPNLITPANVPAQPSSILDPWVEGNSGVWTPYYGDPTLGVITYGTLPAISVSYQDPAAITPQTDPIIDLTYYDTLAVILDLVLATATDIRVKALFDMKVTGTPSAMVQPTQENRADEATTNQRKWQLVEHVFAASGRYIFEIPRQMKYVKLQFKTTGGPGATTIALAIQPRRKIHGV